MFHPDFHLGLPSGGELFAELGISPDLVSELVEDNRAIRCPERGAVYPAYGFASLAPEPPLEPGLHEAASDEALGAGSGVQSGRTEVEEGLGRVNGRGSGGIVKLTDCRVFSEISP